MPPSWTASWSRLGSAGQLPIVRRVTVRAVIVGIMASLVVAVLAPLNDWIWRNPPLYGLYLPLGVTMLLLVMALVINPLLGARRFLTGELVTITVMLLVLGGGVSSGLARVLPGMIAGPAQQLPISPHLAPLGDQGGGSALPSPLFLQIPRQGPILADQPDFSWEITNFFNGSSGVAPSVGHHTTVIWVDADRVEHRAITVRGSAGPGQIDLDTLPGRGLADATVGQVVLMPTTAGVMRPATITGIMPAPVPWRAWIWRLVAWGPLVIGAWICCFALAALVRRQWTENERLPYPIARFTYDLMQEPAKGRRVAELFHRRSFWIGVAIAGGVLVAQALEGAGWLPWAIPTSFNYLPVFSGEPWSLVANAKALYFVHVYFTVVGLSFLLPAQLSFSLWFFVVLTNVVFAVLNRQGLPVTVQQVGEAGVGGWATACVLVIWVGRRHYWAVLRAAFSRTDDQAIHRVRPYVWMLLGGVATMIVWLILAGAIWWHAFVAVVLFLGFALVLGRIVAEAGIPFIGLPAGCHASQLLYGIVGVHVPLAALAPLALVSATVLGDGREHVLPYAVHGEYLANRALPRTTTTARLGWSALVFGALAIGVLVAITVLITAAYQGDGWRDDRWYAMFSEGLNPLLRDWQSHANGAGPAHPTDLWWSMGIGSVVVSALTLCRWAFASWPLHPIGYLVSMTGPTQAIWFSFFLGWLFKTLVMRYGGARIYVALRPLAYGLVAGEALAAGIFLLVAIICQLSGIRVPQMPTIFPT